MEKQIKTFQAPQSGQPQDAQQFADRVVERREIFKARKMDKSSRRSARFMARSAKEAWLNA